MTTRRDVSARYRANELEACGFGSYLGTIAGALVLTEINTLLIGFGLQPATVQAALGLVIVALVSLYGREAHIRTTI
jgi:ribose transport system permease protein